MNYGGLFKKFFSCGTKRSTVNTSPPLTPDSSQTSRLSDVDFDRQSVASAGHELAHVHRKRPLKRQHQVQSQSAPAMRRAAAALTAAANDPSWRRRRDQADRRMHIDIETPVTDVDSKLTVRTEKSLERNHRRLPKNFDALTVQPTPSKGDLNATRIHVSADPSASLPRSKKANEGQRPGFSTLPRHYRKTVLEPTGPALLYLGPTNGHSSPILSVGSGPRKAKKAKAKREIDGKKRKVGK